MTKISLLPPDSGPTTDDIVATVDSGSGITKKVTLASIITLIFSNLFSQRQAWVTPTLTSSWTVWDAGGAGNYGGPQYYKDQMGIVHLRGLARNNTGGSISGASNSLIFTLPAGYRPTQIQLCPSMGADVLNRFDINADGTVKFTGTGSIPTGQWLSLNNVHFLAEQ